VATCEIKLCQNYFRGLFNQSINQHELAMAVAPHIQSSGATEKK